MKHILFITFIWLELTTSSLTAKNSEAQQEKIDKLICAAHDYRMLGKILTKRVKMLKELMRRPPAAYEKRSSAESRQQRERCYALAQEAEQALDKASQLTKESLKLQGFESEACKEQIEQ